ncbi:MAG: hypothetical protein ACYTG2_18270 [Planctomycetota bacterium]|jgi:hypothetical protein
MSHAYRLIPSCASKGLPLLLALTVSVAGATAQGHAPARPQVEPAGPTVQKAVTWAFDLETTGQDVQWTSPTSVDPTAAVFASNYQIDVVEVDVLWTFITLSDIDVTDQIPPELQTGSTTLAGPAPVSFVDEPIVAPPPPEPPALAALLSMGLDAGGSGFFSATDVTLGTMDVDLGGIFGVQTVTITKVHITGSLTIHPAWFDLGAGLAGTSGTPVLTGDGALAGGDPISVTLSGALPNSSATLIIGFSQLGAPFKGGTLVPNPDLLILGLPTGPLGELALAGVWPVGLPPGLSLFMQEWVVDAGGPAGLAATNGLRAVTP